ncbi:hypothetical protein Glove_9g97 [Diversispora epigaea]|uniref:Elongation factor P n=1 Tax=Diversispora epigaea TaxID=1348612 RepID=A0A397JSJ1_9GLOM|nr:hypothetical protein Glove_9g97 [Diversispora epigaea]
MFAFKRNLIYLTKAPLLNYVAQRFLKTATRDISKGNVIEYKDRHFIVTKVDSHFTGRGVSTTKFELKDAITGQKLVERVKPNDSFEVVTIKEKNYNFLYSDGNILHLLNMDTYEELEIESDKLDGGEKSLKLLDDNMNLTVAFIESEGDNQPVTIRLPLMYAYTVISDTPKIGHSTKGPAQKVIEIKGGIQVQVPEFVNVGEKIFITLNDLKYHKRA